MALTKPHPYPVVSLPCDEDLIWDEKLLLKGQSAIHLHIPYSSFDFSKPSLYFFILFCFSVSVEISLAKSFISVVFWSIVDNTNFYQGERWISDHQLLRKMYESLWNIPTVWAFGQSTGKTGILDTQVTKSPVGPTKRLQICSSPGWVLSSSCASLETQSITLFLMNQHTFNEKLNYFLFKTFLGSSGWMQSNPSLLLHVSTSQ